MMEQAETGYKHGAFCGINLNVLIVFPDAVGLGHPRPSALLHEETQVVRAEEQEDRLQATQVTNTPLPKLKTYWRWMRSMTPQRSHHDDQMDTEQLTNTHAFLRRDREIRVCIVFITTEKCLF